VADLVLVQPFEAVARQVIAAKRSPHTRAAYSRDLDAWLLFSRTNAINALSPSLDDATRFRDAHAGSHAPGSTRRACATLASIYGFLFKAGVTSGNPFDGRALRWPSAELYEPTPAVSDADAKAMFASCTSLRDKTILLLLYWTGARRASIAGLRRDHIVGDCAAIRVLTKGDKLRDLPLSADAAQALREWLKRARLGPFVFAGKSADKPLHPATVNVIIASAAQAAGCTSPISPHGFRAGFITAGYDAVAAGKLGELELSRLVGHSSTETTRRYDRGQRAAVSLVAIENVRKGR
jgi:integrase